MSQLIELNYPSSSTDLFQRIETHHLLKQV